MVGWPDVPERVSLDVGSGSKENCNSIDHVHVTTSLNESRWRLFRLGPSAWYQWDCIVLLSTVAFLKQDKASP